MGKRLNNINISLDISTYLTDPQMGAQDWAWQPQFQKKALSSGGTTLMGPLYCPFLLTSLIMFRDFVLFDGLADAEI